MTNHVHLVAVPTHAASLACGIGRAHYDYTRALHQRWGGHGHLWQNRFFSCPLDGDHLWTTLRYVDLNPVRAGMVDDALAYEWSSARAHVEGRDGHTATLLPDGTVLITGGRQINFEDVGASDPAWMCATASRLLLSAPLRFMTPTRYVYLIDGHQRCTLRARRNARDDRSFCRSPDPECTTYWLGQAFAENLP